MKPKQIPRIVRLWLILLGIWGGSLASVVFMAFWLTGSIIGLYLVIALIAGSTLGLWLISWKWQKPLIEWGIVEAKKEKEH